MRIFTPLRTFYSVKFRKELVLCDNVEMFLFIPILYAIRVRLCHPMFAHMFELV